MNNRLRFAFAAILCAFAVWWYVRRTKQETGPPAPPAALDGGVAAAAPLAAPTPAAAPAAAAAQPFRTIDPAARRALLDRIAAARAVREGSAPAPSGSPPSDRPAPLPGRLKPTDLVDGIMPLVPSLQDCYDETRAKRTAPRVTVKFSINVVGEPDVGTLLESVTLDGDDAFRSDPDLATCLRETMLAVELPPLDVGTRAFFMTTMILADDDASAADPDAAP